MFNCCIYVERNIGGVTNVSRLNNLNYVNKLGGKIMKSLKRILKISLTIIGIISCACIQTSAHELYQGVTLRMQDKNSSGKPLLYVHYKYMRNSGVPAHYYDCAIAALNAWDGFANVTDGRCNQVAPANMNISFRCSESVWADLGYSSNTLAATWIKDTNGLDLIYSSNISKTTGIIDLAIIYMNPAGKVFSNGTTDKTKIKNRIQKTMVHEIGHAMGLGHPDRAGYDPISDSTYSIMRQGFPDKKKTGIVPQAHERTDLNNMY